MVDELCRGCQHAGPVTGKGICFAEGGNMDEVVPPATHGKKVVGPGSAGNEIAIGFIKDQSNAMPGS